MSVPPTAAVDGDDRLPAELPPSLWWDLIPLVERLMALLQPASVQVAGPMEALPERHLRTTLQRLCPGSRLLLTAEASGSDGAVQGGRALLLLDGLPVRGGGDLAGWIAATADGWILVRQPEALASFQHQFPGWEVRWSALPQLLVPVAAASPDWAPLLEQQAAALLERGRQLERLSQWAQGQDHRTWQAQRGEAQELLDAAHAKLEAIEASTAWRVTAPLRTSLDRLAELRSRLRRSAHQGSAEPGGPGDAKLRQRRHGRLRQVPGRQPIDPAKPTLLVISHESSFTGAPILAWNLCRGFQAHANVIALSLRPGGLDQALLEDCCLLLQPSRPGQRLSPDLLRGGLGPLPRGLRIDLALVNTMQCWEWPRWLHRQGIPSLLLIHEFAAYIRPGHAFQEACTWASAVVFSSPITWRDMTRRHPVLAHVPVEILPQGRCELPGPAVSGPVGFRLSDLPELRRHHSSAWLESCQLVLGAGEVQPRKGVDLFVEAANRLRQRNPEAPWLFLWLGSHYDPERDFGSSIWIEDQIQRSGLARQLHILGPSRELYAALLARAQLFLLTSRLDPLPNVAIDAMHEGVPVLCFAGASGIADWMADQPALAEPCLARYLDPSQLADRAETLLLDAPRRQQVGEMAQRMARQSFAMERYLAELEAIGQTCRHRRWQQDLDQALLEQEACLDSAVCLPPGAEGASDPVLPYLRSWSQNILPRKPFAGFHPGVYAEEHQLEDQDPLAHWLRAGRPTGSWQRPVLGPDPAAPPPLSVGLHLHVHYPELLEEMLERLQGNRLRPQLFVSLSAPEEEPRVRDLLERWGHGNAELRLTPNRGRDLGPLLVEFGRRLDRDFDLHGHLHTKKSVLIGQDQAAGWRHFLLEHLLGSATTPMLDAVATAMACTPSLGLVYPDDPHALTLGANREPATALAGQIGLPLPLPEAMDFPVGSMFWARRGSLRSLYALPWRYEDFPEEPLGYDGTLLHALERLLPRISEAAGFQTQVTHVPGVRR